MTGYTGFSGDPELQEGNFLAFKVAPSLGDGATYTIEIINGHSGPVELDSDPTLHSPSRLSEHWAKILLKESTASQVSLLRLRADLSEVNEHGGD